MAAVGVTPLVKIGPSTGQDAGDAFGGGAQLQVAPNSEQDDVTREAMT